MAFKGLLGGAAGAALYTAYRDSETILNSKDIASGLYEYWQKRGATNLTEVSRLQKNVDDLQHALLKSLHDRQPTIVVAGGGGRSGLGTATSVVLVAGGVALYLRFVKGWRFSDLMYVTRASLSSLSESVKSGMDAMRTQLEERASDLLERMGMLGSQQEELLAAQGALGSELALVGGKVSAVSEQVGFSNHAILLLCGALSEMAKRVGISNGKYVRELEHLSRSVATTHGGLPGAPAGVAALPATAMMFDGAGGMYHSPAASSSGGSGGGAAGMASLPAPPALAGFSGPNPSMHAVTAGVSASVSAAATPASSDDGSRRPGLGEPAAAKVGGFAGLWSSGR